MPLNSAPKITTAIIGANGMLAKMVRERAPGSYSLHLLDLPDFDMTSRGQVNEVLSGLDPDVIINCAAYTNVDGAETEQGLAMLVNGKSVGFLAEVAKKTNATLVHVSTDYVFDGTKTEPYTESDEPNPQSVYGQSKLLGEQSVISSGLTKYFIVRTSWLYGPGGNNFVETILRLAAERDELRIIDDQVGGPTYTADLADAIYNLLAVAASSPLEAHGLYGAYHFANNGQCSWYEFTKEIVAVAKEFGVTLKTNNVLPIKTEDYPLPAKRPVYSVFDKNKYMQITGCKIPQWQNSLRDYFKIRNKF